MQLPPETAVDKLKRKEINHDLTIKIQNNVVVEAHGKGSLEEFAQNIRSVIGDQVPVDCRPVLDWMLSAYVGSELPKLSYEDLVCRK